jgi:hypothetical protein
MLTLRKLFSLICVIFAFCTNHHSTVSATVLHRGRESSKHADTSVTEHPLQGRRVFWYGFDFAFEFVSNFLLVKEKDILKYKRGMYTHSITTSDILVMSGTCSHCTEFTGLVIYIDGEAGKFPLKNLKPGFNLIYLGVSTVKLPPGAKHIKVMFGASALHYNFTFANRALKRVVNISEKNKFIAYAASKCVTHREKVFDELMRFARSHPQLGRAAALGRCRGASSTAPGEEGGATAAAAGRLNYTSNPILFKPYKYVLCMENSNVPHYMTEKIFNAFQAGAIPLYWGAPDLVRRMFHPDTFIYIDPSDVQPALDRILAIEGNPALYRQILATPVLLQGGGTLRRFFAGGIPLAEALDASRARSSLSNYIWASILTRISPLPAP